MTPAELAADRAVIAAATLPWLPGYEVTTDGDVFSVSSNWRGYGRRALSVSPNFHGYASVRVNVGGRRLHVCVHRLVAEAFHGAMPDGKQVRHLDGNRMNPRACNLVYGTAAENAEDRHTHGTTARGVRNGYARLTDEVVHRARSMASAGVSHAQIAREFGVNKTTISRAVTRRQWRHVQDSPALDEVSRG